MFTEKNIPVWKLLIFWCFLNKWQPTTMWARALRRRSSGWSAVRSDHGSYYIVWTVGSRLSLSQPMMGVRPVNGLSHAFTTQILLRKPSIVNHHSDQSVQWYHPPGVLHSKNIIRDFNAINITPERGQLEIWKILSSILNSSYFTIKIKHSWCRKINKKYLLIIFVKNKYQIK